GCAVNCLFPRQVARVRFRNLGVHLVTRGVKLYVEAVENDLIAAIEAGNGAGLCIAQDRAACNATNMTDTIERRPLQGPGGFAIRRILSTGDPSGVRLDSRYDLC